MHDTEQLRPLKARPPVMVDYRQHLDIMTATNARQHGFDFNGTQTRPRHTAR